jgi:hypothetical protein
MPKKLVGTLRYADFPPVGKDIDIKPRLRRSARAARVSRAPVPDGVLGKDEYAGAPVNHGFIPVGGHDMGGQETRFRLAYDDTRLYLAVEADEKNASAIKTPDRERDGNIWEDDSIELFLDTKHDRKTYYQFLSNLKGAGYDGAGGPEFGRWGTDKRWNAEWQSVAKIGRKGYVMEVAVPFAELGVSPPKPGDVWGLNVGRTRSGPTGKTPSGTFAAWAFVQSGFHEVSRYSGGSGVRPVQCTLTIRSWSVNP